jgi:hypothetical protein
MIRIPRAGILGLAAVLSMGTALASDEPDELMPGRIALIRDGSLAKFVAKPITPNLFDLPNTGVGGNEPTTEGGSLQIFDTAGSASDTYTLPPGGWKGLGNPAGSRGWKYRGLGSIADPCKVVLVKQKVVKAVCKGAGVDMTTPFGGNIGIIVNVGSDTKRYCAEFGGQVVRSDAVLLKRKSAPAPVVCPTQGGGGSTSTSTSTTTSSSTLGTTPTTTSTLDPGIPCCGGATFSSFTNNDANGNCGNFLTATGTQYDTLDCGGLYFGGGDNSVPLPAVTPNHSVSITEIVSCTGQTATLGGTTSTQTGNDLFCSTPGCFFGGPLPIPNTGSTPTSTCEINTVATAATGTLDCEFGTAQVDLPLNSEIFLVGDTNEPLTPGIQPCPRCTGGNINTPNSGTCQGGADNGMSCTPANTAQGLPQYPTSHDCRPALSLSIGTIPIGFALTSGTTTWSATAAPNPNSTGQNRVFCGYCRDGLTLSFDADGNGGNGNQFQQCWENGMAVGTACLGTPNATCQQRTQGAFGPNGAAVRTINAVGLAAGSITDGLAHNQRLVSAFCIPPTFNATIDSAANLPGPGAVGFNGSIDLCTAGNPCP